VPVAVHVELWQPKIVLAFRVLSRLLAKPCSACGVGARDSILMLPWRAVVNAVSVNSAD
jgi:hypothetical protein